MKWTQANSIEVDVAWQTATPAPIDLMSMQIGDFIAATIDAEHLLAVAHKLSESDELHCVVSFAKGLAESLNNLARHLRQYEVKRNEMEERAARGVPFPSFGECVIMDVVEAYHLTSAEIAEHRTVADWLIFYKRKCAEMLYQRNLSALMMKKYQNVKK